MATPRRPYFRVEDTVLSKPWTNDELASLVRLIAHMHTRWAREHPDDPTRCAIGPEDAMRITRKRRPDAAFRLLESLAACADLEVERGDIAPTSAGHRADIGRTSSERRSDVASIAWPNLLKTQAWVPRKSGVKDKDKEKEKEKDAKREETPREKCSTRNAPEPRGVAAEGALDDQLSPSQLVQLLAIRPRGILYHRRDVAIWYAATAPRMRARGHQDLWRGALSWWPRVTGEEIMQAYRWAENRALQDTPTPTAELDVPAEQPGEGIEWGGKI